MQGAAKDKTRILYLAPYTCESTSRSGLQRVAVQVARALLGMADVEFVKWDPIDGQLRYFNARDLTNFFRTSPWPEGVRINPFAERRRYRFDETLGEDKAGTWLLMPEISYLSPGGAEFYARIVAQAREYGIGTATIFYDLIPITNPDYQSAGSLLHERYVRELLTVDLVLPISHYSAEVLRAYESEHFKLDDAGRVRIGHTIAAVPLATVNDDARMVPAHPDPAARNLVVLLGTVEPRKRQVEVLRAFRHARLHERFGLQLVVVGSLHPKVAEAFTALVESDPGITYLGYADQALVADLFSRARFSVFASNDEGFGLPICESLAHGVPCLTADFGAMREVGWGGGCLLLDVNDEAELKRGLERLAQDDALVAQLRSEITERPFRTWVDYGNDLLGAMEAYRDETVRREEDDATRALRAFLSTRPPARTLPILGEEWSLVDLNYGDRGLGLAGPAGPGHRLAIVFSGSIDAVDGLDAGDRARVFGADVWAVADRPTFEGLVAKASAAAYPGLLPSDCVIGSETDAEAAIVAAILGKARAHRRRRVIAAREAALQIAAEGAPEFRQDPLLGIVISTYNRGPFVAENVRWLLSQIGRYKGRVTLTVVDNASTDDTELRLAGFAGAPHLRIVRNAANVGMLGNLQVCSTLTGAQHVWIVGDDDFILPEALHTVLEAVEAKPYLPFAFVNFGVYHRVALGPTDTAEGLVKDPVQLAPDPSPTGLYRVNAIAAEHDNLFTAIYPIVFRADILAACFNYTFTGKPFSSLIESIPTTKQILESYGETEALWIAPIGIVGNAHNSWSRYRVPWHGVLMPLAFELAREAGVDSAKLYTWSQLHRGLFAEAWGLFPDQSLKDTFPPAIADVSRRIFRADLEASGPPARTPQP